MNKVKRMERVETSIYMERALEDIDIEKYTWQCLGCGRVWLMRDSARNCNHSDYVFYGRRRFSCLRNEWSLDEAWRSGIMKNWNRYQRLRQRELCKKGKCVFGAKKVDKYGEHRECIFCGGKRYPSFLRDIFYVDVETKRKE